MTDFLSQEISLISFSDKRLLSTGEGRQTDREKNIPSSSTERFAGDKRTPARDSSVQSHRADAQMPPLAVGPQSHPGRDTACVVTLKPHQSRVYTTKQKTTKAIETKFPCGEKGRIISSSLPARGSAAAAEAAQQQRQQNSSSSTPFLVQGTSHSWTSGDDLAI